MDDQDRILSFLRMAGPSLPTKVGKHINQQLLITSASLSDLASRGKVKISNLKVGGSPLYYLPGQEEQLFKFASNNLNPKDFQVLEKLKEKKILREKDLDLLEKVSLRSMKDFSVPLHVSFEGKTELFWKWHLLSTEEANVNIGNYLDGISLSDNKNNDNNNNNNNNNSGTNNNYNGDEKGNNKNKGNNGNSTQIPVSPLPPPIEARNELPTTSYKPLNDSSSSYKAEVGYNKDNMLKDDNTENTPSITIRQPSEIKNREENNNLEQFEQRENKRINNIEDVDQKKESTLSKEKSLIKEIRKPIEDTFLPQLEKFFRHLKVDIEQKETIRKNAEMSFILKVPSAVGEITYYCKAKNKKRCDEKDLSSAYMEAQMKKMPLLFLYTEELGKKAEEMLEAKAFENVVVRKVN